MVIFIHMKKFLLGLVAVCLIASPLLTSAARFQSGSSVTIRTNELVEENFYGFGKDVSVVGDVLGDAVLAGGNVLVSGTVSGDVLAAGGTVNVVGDVAGDVRVFGGTTSIAGHVAGDVLAAGGTVVIASGSEVSGDVIVGGGDVVIDGKVLGNVRMAGGSVRINGEVKGDTSIAGADDVVIGSMARLTGSFTYHSTREARIEDGAAIVGGVSFQPIERKDQSASPQTAKEWAGVVFAFLGFWMLVKIVSLIIVSLVVFRLFGPWVERVVAEVRRSFWGNAGFGFVTIILVPIAIVLLCITVAGFLLALTTGLLYGLFIIISSIVASIVVGAFLCETAFGKKEWMFTNGSVVLGVVAFQLVKVVPIIGWIVCMLVFFASCGAVVRWFARVVRS